MGRCYGNVAFECPKSVEVVALERMSEVQSVYTGQYPVDGIVALGR